MQNTLCQEGTGDKQSTPSKESEKQSLSTTESSFSMEKLNEKKTFMIYGGGLHLEDVTHLTPMPSIPTTAIVTPNSPLPGPNPISLNGHSCTLN